MLCLIDESFLSQERLTRWAVLQFQGNISLHIISIYSVSLLLGLFGLQVMEMHFDIACGGKI